MCFNLACICKILFWPSEFDVDMYRKENSCNDFFNDLSKELDLYTKVMIEEKIEMITSKVTLIGKLQLS